MDQTGLIDLFSAVVIGGVLGWEVSQLWQLKSSIIYELSFVWNAFSRKVALEKS